MMNEDLNCIDLVAAAQTEKKIKCGYNLNNVLIAIIILNEKCFPSHIFVNTALIEDPRDFIKQQNVSLDESYLVSEFTFQRLADIISL